MGVLIRKKIKSNGWWIFINHKHKRRSIYIGDKETAIKIGNRIKERLVLSEFDLKPKRKEVDIDYLTFLEIREVMKAIFSLKKTANIKQKEGRNGH